MNIQKIYQISQFGQQILSSSRIPYFGKGGLGWIAVPARGYVVPGPGSGAGRGGGAGGTVRESGGALGEYGAAKEEEFFYHKKREQLEKIKAKLNKEEAKPPKLTKKDDPK
ncbi:hypothetical protein ABMA27_012940 [Loxostege sticticalis]|uniref:Mitochondrial ATPase inhibitor n=1 Tax=Loxostege sticticalis TaxID=481309 RepID=A0ABR3H0Q4_LOXSC